MLNEGIKGLAREAVTNEKTALVMGSGELEVYATPAMAALAEKAAYTSVADVLDEGMGTVGTRMEISHVSATPVGMCVTAHTELIGIEGRKLIFSVEVNDETGLIGKGIHERFIVDNQKFQQKTNGKL